VLTGSLHVDMPRKNGLVKLNRPSCRRPADPDTNYASVRLRRTSVRIDERASAELSGADLWQGVPYPACANRKVDCAVTNMRLVLCVLAVAFPAVEGLVDFRIIGSRAYLIGRFVR